MRHLQGSLKCYSRTSVQRLYKNKYLREVLKLKSSIDNWNDMYSDELNENKIQQLIRIEVLGGQLSRKYAWAIPDANALKVLKHFSPIIEIGCGKNYWGYLLQTMYFGEHIGFDIHLSHHSYGLVHQGSAEVLLDSQYHQHTLFLCYPDESCSLAIECFNNYEGEYIIHVGELMMTGGTYSAAQAPWGRTTSSEFQVNLAEQFHCIYMSPIPRFPFSLDHITVWKRNIYTYGKDSILNGDIQVDNEEDSWIIMDKKERLSYKMASEELSYLLPKDNENK